MNKTSGAIDRRSLLRALAVTSLGTGETGASSILTVARPLRQLLDPSSEVRVGMIGTSGHTGIVLDALSKTPKARLVAYALRDAARLPEEKDRLQAAGGLEQEKRRLGRHPSCEPATRFYETYQEMLDREQLDVVGICLPYSAIPYASMAAVARGIHVMSEKPLATELSLLHRLQKLAQEKGVQVSAMLDMRVSPPVQALRETIQKGLIGEPLLASAQKSYKFGDDRPWFYKRGDIYGGTIPWIGIHVLDLIAYTTQLAFTHVSAFQSNRAHPEFPATEDNAGILLRLSNGGTAVVTLDYLRPESAPTHGDDRLRVIGTKGVVEMRDERVELMTQQDGAHQLTLPSSRSLFADFVAFLRGQSHPVLHPDEAFEITRICLLARQSADERRVLNV
ncbi:MAG: Gfo/Idh/MocA family oxidoreductase [Acidobacteriota bacterium]